MDDDQAITNIHLHSFGSIGEKKSENVENDGVLRIQYSVDGILSSQSLGSEQADLRFMRMQTLGEAVSMLQDIKEAWASQETFFFFFFFG